jgi:hypothetical protein
MPNYSKKRKKKYGGTKIRDKSFSKKTLGSRKARDQLRAQISNPKRATQNLNKMRRLIRNQPNMPLYYAQDDAPYYAQDDAPYYAQDDAPYYAQDDAPDDAQDDAPDGFYDVVWNGIGNGEEWTQGRIDGLNEPWRDDNGHRLNQHPIVGAPVEGRSDDWVRGYQSAFDNNILGQANVFNINDSDDDDSDDDAEEEQEYVSENEAEEEQEYVSENEDEPPRVIQNDAPQVRVPQVIALDGRQEIPQEIPQNCGMCFGPLNNGTNIIRTNCDGAHHYFHQNCFEAHLNIGRNRQNSRCPAGHDYEDYQNIGPIPRRGGTKKHMTKKRRKGKKRKSRKNK